MENNTSAITDEYDELDYSSFEKADASETEEATDTNEELEVEEQEAEEASLETEEQNEEETESKQEKEYTGLEIEFLKNLNEKYDFNLELEDDVDVPKTLENILEGMTKAIAERNEYVKELEEKAKSTIVAEKLNPTAKALIEFLETNENGIDDFLKSYRNEAYELEQGYQAWKSLPKEELIQEYYKQKGYTEEKTQDLFNRLKRDDAIDSRVEEILEEVELWYQTGKNKLAENTLQQEKQKLETDQQKFLQELEKDKVEVATILSKTTHIGNVPLNDSIKRDLFVTLTTINQDTGNLVIEDLLRSNENLLKAAFFVKYENEYNKAYKAIASTSKEEGKKVIINKLLDKPIVAKKSKTVSNNKQSMIDVWNAL